MLLGGTDFAEVAKKIKGSGADIILNTINGDSNIAFFNSINKADIIPSKVAIMSLSIGENEIQAFRVYLQKHNPQEAEHVFKEHICGTYACWNYFESINSLLNNDFIGKFKKKYGINYKVTDPMEAAYFGVYLWRQAVNECQDTNNSKNILNHLYSLSIPAPEGIISISNNNHAMKTVRIGRVNDAGSFDITWAADMPISPDPYPNFRTKAYWEDFLNKLYEKWNGNWAAGAAVVKPES